MAKIINFNDAKFNITNEDVFNLFIIFNYIQKNIFDVDLDILMKSLAKYREMPRFRDIYKNLIIKINDNGVFYVDLLEVFEKEKYDRKISEYPNKKHLFRVLMTDDEIEKMKEKYNKDILSLFDSLMFYVNQDLTYGLDGWSLISEDEYIKLPNYPGVVTGKFIGKKKDGKVLKRIKEKAIEELKNSYE